MDLVLQSSFDVTTADCDMNARLRLGGLVNYLVLAAISSADTLGFGYAGLKSQQLFWVLSRMNVEIYKPLKWYDKAMVETWPKDVDGIQYLRDFIVRNQHDEITARCTSGWLAIDTLSKRPRKVQEDYSYIFNRMKDRHALEQRPDKLPAAGQGISCDISPTWFDLDVNRHVTSSRYIDWMMDTLPMDYHLEHYPTRLSVNFIKETMYGEEIRLIRSDQAGNSFLFSGRNLTDEKEKFRGRIEF